MTPGDGRGAIPGGTDGEDCPPLPPERLAEICTVCEPWLAGQRWFPGTEQPICDTVFMFGPMGPATCQFGILMARATTAATSEVVQIFVALATGEAAADMRADRLIGVLADGTHVFDAADHPAMVDGSISRLGLAGSWDASRAHRITGEQSNTSIIVPGLNGTPDGILKIFRILTAGQKPDIEIPAFLTERGNFHGVPALFGSNSIPAPMIFPDEKPENQVTTFAFSEFVSGADDGYELGCAMAEKGEDFTEFAADLGTALAQLHSELAAMPVDTPGAAGRLDVTSTPEGLADRLAHRADDALTKAALDELTTIRPAIMEVLGRVADLPHLPAPQRIHGDLHLGQTLHSRTRGWIFLDFEGEPLRPLDERRRPAQALQDVAGMLRSLDYAAAIGGASSPQWQSRARESFINAYGITGPDQHILLTALELDRALYEVLYEQAYVSPHRQSWLSIPCAAVIRLARKSEPMKR